MVPVDEQVVSDKAGRGTFPMTVFGVHQAQFALPENGPRLRVKTVQAIGAEEEVDAFTIGDC